jgi:hypothetical protein
MKRNMITIAGLSAVILAAQSMPAQAINREWSAVAGFAGGVLVANAFHHNRGYYAQPVCYQRPVQQVIYQPVQTLVYQEPVRTGYYEWLTERVWVPGCWVYEDRGYSAPYKIWQPGYYTTVRNKVWVDTSRNPYGW